MIQSASLLSKVPTGACKDSVPRKQPCLVEYKVVNIGAFIASLIGTLTVKLVLSASFMAQIATPFVAMLTVPEPSPVECSGLRGKAGTRTL